MIICFNNNSLPPTPSKKKRYLCIPRFRSHCNYILYRETSSIKVNDIASQIADHVGAAVEATNTLPAADRALTFHYNRCSPKRRRLIAPKSVDTAAAQASDISSTSISAKIYVAQGIIAEERKVELGEHLKVSSDFDEGLISLSKMVAVLCEQHLFLPLLRAFEMFLPSCSLLPFIRALQVCEKSSIRLLIRAFEMFLSFKTHWVLHNLLIKIKELLKLYSFFTVFHLMLNINSVG